jgi:hypothetical protein
LSVAFWMPAEFWRSALGSSGRLTPQAIDEYVAAIEPYMLIAVVQGQVTITGVISYKEPAALDESVTIEDVHGNIYKPISEKSVDPRMTSLVQTMKPILSNSIGNLGSHMEFVFFPATDKDGQPIADPLKDGRLQVHLGDKTLRYRLPLGCFLPPVIDKKTGEEFPGNYHYNPFTGSKLVLEDQK